MKTLDKILFWFLVQIGFIVLLYNMGLFPSRIVLDNLLWAGQSSLKWAFSYLSIIPYCLVICLIYTVVGIIVTKHVPIHSKKWWIIASVCYLVFLIISGLCSYLMTGYAFYDSYGFAIIDIWFAPILWLGEVELFLFLAEKWKEKPVVIKLWTCLQKVTKWILISLFLGIIVFTLFALFTGCTKESATKQKYKGTVFGVDVSHHNGVIDWKLLAEKEKMTFVFVKATEGSTMADPTYNTNVSAARKAGLKVGAYHFLTTSSSAEKQFGNFKRNVKEQDIDLLPVLDAERITKGYPMTDKEYVKHVRTWVDLCKEHFGKAPIIYSSIGFYRKYFKGKFDDCLFWAGDVHAPRSFVNKEDWVIWQKTVRKCQGCSSRLDVNVLASGKTLDDIALHPVDTQSFDGIDVSHHNGKIDWKKVKSEYPNLKFVYVKCTEGATYVDPEFKANAKGARNQGYSVGAYHYFRMTSGAHDQFHNFKIQLDRFDFNLIPMVDVEKDDGKPRKELQDSLHVLLNLLEKEYGVKPMLYGTNSSYNKFCAPEFNRYPMYIGRYGDTAPVVKGPGYYTIWQFSETEIINGIPKPVDLCRFNPNKGITDIAVVSGCTPKQSTKPLSEYAEESRREAARLEKERQDEIERSKAIVLFKVNLNQPIEDILKELNEQPEIDVAFDSFKNENDQYFCGVTIKGIPFGMNLLYKMKGQSVIIQSASFLTSQSSDIVIKIIVSLLTEYYGEPDIADTIEDQYTWMGSHFIKARHLRVPEGGWTFYFSK